MKKKIFVSLIAASSLLASTPCYAADVSSLSYKELLQAYYDLEAKYNELAGIEATEPAEETPADETTSPFEATLGAGFYTAGLDIPCGTYTLTAVSGSGNVHSREAGINEIMANPTDEWSIDTYNGARFSSGSVLEVSGDLVLQISSDDSQLNNMTARVIGPEVQCDFGAGNYVAGVDFPVGTYNVVALEGSGNVHSSEADLNEIFSVEADGWGIYQVNNVKFEEGAILEISGCSIQLVPVGE